ncbi:MAG: hypothetical protein ACOYB3_02065 [Azonexus sp.]
MKIVTIRQSLQHVVDNPVLKTDDLIGLPAHELVSRTLFEIANGAQISERGSMSRANIARNMIFNRLVGRRRPGTHPATQQKVELEFIDLVGAELES